MADRTSVFLVIGYLGASVWAAFELQWSIPARENPMRPAEITQTQFSVPSVAIGELDAFAELVERPLFTPNRRAPSPDDQSASDQAEAQNAKLPLELTNARLTAIFIDGDRFTALVEQGNGTTLPLRVGSKFDEWQVDEIQEDRMTLVADGQRQTLEVYRFDTPPKVDPRRRRPPEAKRHVNGKQPTQHARTQGAGGLAPQQPSEDRRTMPRQNLTPQEGTTQWPK